MRKLPMLLAVAERVRWVLTFSAVTAALDTTAPVLSFTSPAIVPVIVCPKIGRLKQAKRIETTTEKPKADRMSCPLTNNLDGVLFADWQISVVLIARKSIPTKQPANDQQSTARGESRCRRCSSNYCRNGRNWSNTIFS